MKNELTVQDWGRLIGQKVQTPDGIKKISEVRNSTIMCELENHFARRCYKRNYCKPILRTLGQMTEEEKIVFADINGVNNSEHLNVRIFDDRVWFNNSRNKERSVTSIYTVDWLTQEGFDIRGWIDAGLAIKDGSE